MRIAMIDPSLFTLPYDDHLCRALFERGNSVTLFTRPLRHEEPRIEFGYWRSESFYRLAESPAARRLPRKVRPALKGLEHLGGMAALLRDLRRLSPDVVHFQWLPVPAVDRLLLPLFRGVAPIFLTVHDSKGLLAPTSRFQLTGWSEFLRSFDRLVVHLEASRKELEGQGVAAERIVVIPHGVLGYDERAPQPEEAPRAEGERRVLAFGTIKHYKGVDILLRAFALLPQDLRDTTKVWVVGEPHMPMDELRRLSTELGIEGRVDWDTRFVADEEIPQILRASDVIAFPYRRIDASGVLMMVLPYARPIVATAVGCFAELLTDGETAAVVEPEDPAAFAAGLEEVLRDPERGAEMAARARDMALRQLSWDQIAIRTENAYRQAIAERAG